MSNYKIVASDLDGTLLNSNFKISDENLLAIEEISKKGVQFVPSTGRTYSEIYDEIKNNSNVRYIICSNGTVVFDKLTKNKILMCMSKPVAKKIFDILYSYETHITYRYDGNSYVDADYQDEKSYKYYKVWENHISVIKNFSIPISDFKETSYSIDNIETIAAFFHNDDDLEKAKEEILKIGGLIVTAACDHSLEIFSDKAGKGNALYKLCDMLNVDYKDTISVGDSDNDASITKAAGLGLATKNACDFLKEIADNVICSNDEHIVKYVLENYIEE